MRFKIWGKDYELSEKELKQQLELIGVQNPFSLINELIRKGSATVGNTKLFVLKYE